MLFCLWENGTKAIFFHLLFLPDSILKTAHTLSMCSFGQNKTPAPAVLPMQVFV
jgi:hypothetical protein